MPYSKLPHPCVDCSKPVNNHKSRCSRCAKIRIKQNNPEVYKARMARKRERKRASGCCIRCGDERKSTLYCANCLEKLAHERKIERNKLRIEVITHYGNKCECCGESLPEFLSIDHINSGGNAHRREIKASSINLYRWLKNNNYPDGFRILCMNCNWSFGIYGEEHIKNILNQFNLHII